MHVEKQVAEQTELVNSQQSELNSSETTQEQLRHLVRQIRYVADKYGINGDSGYHELTQLFHFSSR